MKKIIINTIIISLLAVTSIFADNNTSNNNSNQHSAISTQQTTSQTALVIITDLNGKTVYSETFTVDTENGSNIKLNPSSKLPKGMYIVTVTVGNEKMTDKLIVK